MKNDDDRDYSGQHERILAREERKLDRARDKAAALERNAEKAIEAAIKASRRALQNDVKKAVTRQDTGNVSEIERRLVRQAEYGDGQIFVDEGKITGKREKAAPWLRAADDPEDDDY